MWSQADVDDRDARVRRRLGDVAFPAREAARTQLALLYVRKAVRLEVVLAIGLQGRLPWHVCRRVAEFAV